MLRDKSIENWITFSKRLGNQRKKILPSMSSEMNIEEMTRVELDI